MSLVNGALPCVGKRKLGCCKLKQSALSLKAEISKAKYKEGCASVG